MRKTVLVLVSVLLLCSCGLIRKVFHRNEKPGCPVGRNVGAEKILAGDEKSIKAAKKAEKYKIRGSR
jgi:hypothetical protein